MIADVRAVIFDLDYTLLDYDSRRVARYRRAFEWAAERYEVDVDAALRRWQDLDDGEARPGWRLRRVLEEVTGGATVDVEAAMSMIEDPAGLDLCAGVVETLQALHPRFPLGLITNGPAEQQLRKVRHFELESYFAAITVSGELGIEKPDPRIFLHTAELLDVDPRSCVMVGDQLCNDIEGALAAGMTAVWIPHRYQDRPSAAQAHHQVASVADLLPLLGGAAVAVP